MKAIKMSNKDNNMRLKIGWQKVQKNTWQIQVLLVQNIHGVRASK